LRASVDQIFDDQPRDPLEDDLLTSLPTTVSTRPTFHGSGAVSFSTKGEYGVRLMVQLGRHVGTGPASLTEIAAEEDLPRPYLEQLAIGLRDAGLVTSTRGAHGGYQLARPAAEIAMSDVLRALEGPLAPMVCASEDPEHALVCDRTSRCTVNLLWVRIRDAIAGALDDMTLADLVPPRDLLDPTGRLIHAEHPRLELTTLPPIDDQPTRHGAVTAS
jgi:Rrf2 family cysteine metabolism transcriptional repressor